MRPEASLFNAFEIFDHTGSYPMFAGCWWDLRIRRCFSLRAEINLHADELPFPSMS
jgi:hypothetical protein